MTPKQPLITSHTDWTPELLQEIWTHIEDIAINDLGLDYYQPQIEMVSAEQMLDAYSSIGMPVNYNHWSFGRDFLKNKSKYDSGRMNLAYEMVIGTAPLTIAYLMEENDAITQALVLAHASCGHSFVFKNNYLFKEWSPAESIVDIMIYARDYIKRCEEKYGELEVEALLDAAHSLLRNSVDKQKRRYKKNLNEQEKLIKAAQEEQEQHDNLDIIIQTTSIKQPIKQESSLIGDEENLLYFIMKNSPILKDWQREIINILLRINQAMYPSMQTQVVHEGFATFTHFYIMTELEKRGLISPDAQIAWLHLHSNVIFQPDHKSKYYDGKFNPYALGLDMFNDIRRICENPTAEDREWFPNMAGGDWRTEIKNAASEFNDESFIAQYLSPTLMRKYKLMIVDLSLNSNTAIVKEICDDLGYKSIRRTISDTYNLISKIPNIIVKGAKMDGERTLELEYQPYKDRSLNKDYAMKTLSYAKQLWGYTVNLKLDPIIDYKYSV